MSPKLALRNYQRIVLVVAVLAIQFGPAAMLPPPMLRTVCGVVADAEEVVGQKVASAGKAAVDLAMKPIAIVGGLKAAAVGTGMKMGGGAIKFVGEKMAKDGAIIATAGAGIKGAGLGVAALSLKPAAEKIVSAGQVAENSLDAASKAANGFAKSVGDTSVQIGATLDSPLLGHHHKEVNFTAGLETALNNPAFKGASQHLHQQQLSQQSVELQTPQQPVQVAAASATQSAESSEHTITKRANKIDPEAMRSALNLVKEAKMEDCVARAICDLNCNPQGFGQDGKQVFMNMVRLQGSNVLEESDSKYFREAAGKGRANSGKCDQCVSIYPNCKSKSTDLIKLASHIRMD